MDQPQRNRDDDCDVIFRIGKQSFMACREVLIQKVKFFESMFTLDMKEKNEFIVHLDSEVINPNVFDAILNFIYFSKINFSVNNVRALYRAADFLCFTELCQKIVEYMNSNMIPENIPTFMTIATAYKLETVEENCKKCILIKSKDFLDKGIVDHLTYDQLTTLLNTPNLKADIQFGYVMKWLGAGDLGEENRQEKLIDLLRIVRLEKLSSKFLDEVVARKELIIENLEILQLVFQATITNLKILQSLLNFREGQSDRFHTAYNRERQNAWRLSDQVSELKDRLSCAGLNGDL